MARFYRKCVKVFDRYDGGSVIVLAGIAAADRTELVVCERNVDSGVYDDYVLIPHVFVVKTIPRYSVVPAKHCKTTCSKRFKSISQA